MVAVPLDSEDSGVLPRVSEDGGDRSSVDDALDVSDSGPVPIRVDSDDRGPQIDLSSSEFEFPVRKAKGDQETEENTLLDLTALEQRAAAEEASETSLERPKALPPIPSDSEEVAVAPNNRGKIGAIRKVLVECGLCGFHVQVPVEFFGKAIHCPNCAGNSIFTESTLDPIKDEILDRLGADTNERGAIYRGEPAEPSVWRELMASSAIKSFLVGVGLGLLVLGAMWGAVSYRRTRAQGRIVDQAAREGWRYARNTGEDAFHEPWCRSLDAQRPTERVSAEDFAKRKLQRHECE
ncbi:MAG: hypothetical protein JKY65_12890 [Planctomycetes bacterium]|nr:hypothetical protein [Planctomycetota bacterium]